MSLVPQSEQFLGKIEARFGVGFEVGCQEKLENDPNPNPTSNLALNLNTPQKLQKFSPIYGKIHEVGFEVGFIRPTFVILKYRTCGRRCCRRPHL